jgi:glycosyltransferase involved in cell wall biosynthesis
LTPPAASRPIPAMKKAIVIPSYKAAKTLPSVLERIPKEYWENDGIAIIVNDCSPDDTGAVADELAQQWPGVTVVHHEKNQGYGGAQKSGLTKGLELGARAFAIVHSDGQYAPEVVLKLLAPIEAGQAHIVQGSRMLEGGALEGGMPLVRYIPNKALTTVENLSFGTSMAEFHSGYMLYSGDLLEQVPYLKLQNNYNFDAEMILMAHLLGYRCAEVAIPTRYDDEVSSLDPIPYGINVLKMVGRHLIGHYRELLLRHGAEPAPAPETRRRVIWGFAAGLGAAALVSGIVTLVFGRRRD